MSQPFLIIKQQSPSIRLLKDTSKTFEQNRTGVSGGQTLTSTSELNGSGGTDGNNFQETMMSRNSREEMVSAENSEEDEECMNNLGGMSS